VVVFIGVNAVVVTVGELIVEVAKPYSPLWILEKFKNNLAMKAIGHRKVFKLIPIKTAYAVIGCKPNKAFAVLNNFVNLRAR
jgi:hypothetical protein